MGVNRLKEIKPFNIDLMFATDAEMRSLRPTTKTDIYEGITSNFHDDGLFSTLTFGRVGTPDRDSRFSYIRLNAEVIHPAIYEVLKKLKRSYIDIINSQMYAKWDPELRDFVPSDMIDGETGMAFFTRYLHRLDPLKNNSKKRNMYVDVFDKYKHQALMHNCIVIPAGIRDVYVDQDGRDVQDEINDYYRALISIASSINLIGARQNDPAVDIPRRNLQSTMNEIYAYLKSILDGKKGLIQAKWGGRKIALGTRNVLSSMEMLADTLGSPRAPKVTDIYIGLLQTIISVLPITINRLKERFLADIFTSVSQPTLLIDPKTYKLVNVNLEPHIWDKWGTNDGIEKKMREFEDEANRHKYIKIHGHYLYLIYQKGNVFKVFRDINDLPNPEMINDVHPMTYAELYYLCNYEGWYDLVGLVTRYPIAGIFSIFPGNIYTKTDDAAFECYELGDDWETKVGYAREYPSAHLNNQLNKQTSWFNTAAVSSVKLKALSADFDGDVVSVNIPLTETATNEIRRVLNSRSSIIGANGKFNFSANTNIPSRVINSLTSNIEGEFDIQ